MAGLKPVELLIIVGILLVLFGSSQIPKLARSLGQAQKEFKSGLDEGMNESESEEA
jgi:sec-independent protein translocase protein TatA